MDIWDVSCLPDAMIVHKPLYKSIPDLACDAANHRKVRTSLPAELEPIRQKSYNNQDFAARSTVLPASGDRSTMTDQEERELREQLARLLQEHRDLDAAIAALQDSPGSDILQVQRLKKRKLYLRDRISFIEDQITPDIIA
jgi:hypothetical protein